MARTYKRDANGRFAGGGGSGRVTGGSLKARSSARRSRAKLAGKAQGDTSLSGSMSRRAQRAAVTRTGKAAAAAKAANRTKLAGGRRAGTVGKVRALKPAETTVAAKPTVYRSRAQASARYQERARMTMDKVGGVRNQIRSTTNQQGNILTGRAESQVVRRKVAEGAASPASRSATRAMNRSTKIGNRITDLNNQRNQLIASTPSARFRNKSNPEYKQLFKIQKSIQTQQRADDFYSSNPRQASRRAGSRRRR